ncbi:MAG: alpha/beta fold hydrolase, partial [Fimbriiglobus sp.]|nr:alpha/beta fold hydrolase [Fimbriiglobus sp.]
GSGLPLVLVHAFPLDRRMWEPQAELADACRLLTPDVPGLGESGLPPGGWSVDSFADTLAEWLTALGVEKAIVGGLSMGGYIALAFARRHPGRVRGLLLADTRAEADTDEAKANRAKSIELVQTHGPTALIEQMLPKLLAPNAVQFHAAVERRIRELAGSQSVEGVSAALAALRDRPDSLAALAGFHFPTLVLVGSADAVTPPSAAQAMADRLNDVTAETLWNAGHLPSLETPRLFNAAVRRWLAAIG